MIEMVNKNDKSRNGGRDRDGKSRIPNPRLPKSLDSRNYVDTAEMVVLHLNGEKAHERFNMDGNEIILKSKSEIEQNQKFKLTTTKIRNLLSLLNVIQQMVKEKPENQLGDDIMGKIQYFKMRCAYEAGRESSVKDFVKKSNLMAYIDQIGDSKEGFELFFHYVEALVAYHRYYGGENN